MPAICRGIVWSQGLIAHHLVRLLPGWHGCFRDRTQGAGFGWCCKGGHRSDTYPLNLPPFVRRSALGRQFMKRMGVHFKSGRLGVGGDLTRRARAFLTIWKAVGEQDLAIAEIVQHDSADHDPEDYYLRLARRFKPVPADLKVLLVKSTAKDLGLEVLWRHLARGGLRVEDTNSPHMDILRPSGVDRTAAIVRGAMEGRPLPDSDRSHST